MSISISEIKQSFISRSEHGNVNIKVLLLSTRKLEQTEAGTLKAGPESLMANK